MIVALLILPFILQGNTSKFINPFCGYIFAPNLKLPLCLSQNVSDIQRKDKGQLYSTNFVIEPFPSRTNFFWHQIFISHNTICFSVPMCTFEIAT